MDHPSIANIYSQEELQKSWNLIQQAEKITLLTHYKPDGDGVSACAALDILLRKHGKQVEAVYPSELETPIKRQAEKVLVNTHEQTPDLIIMCDTANYERLYYPEAFKSIPSINIDHHVSNSITGTLNFITTNVSSTCEQVYHLIKGWDADNFDLAISEAILYGILFDSQSFNTLSTYSSTLKVAADLMDRGANMAQLQAELFQNKNPKIIELWGSMMSNIALAQNGKAAWSVIRQEDLQKRNLEPGSLAGFINFLAQISEIDISILFYETKDGKTKVSLRSKKADVNALAKQFGGGGHKHASGIMVDKPIDQVVQELTQAIEMR